MLFRVGGFKSFTKDGRVVNCPENLYNLRVLDGLRQQELKLKLRILDQYVFCHALREPNGIGIALDQNVFVGWLRYRIKRGGEMN